MKNAYRYVALGLAALSLAGFSSSAHAQSLQTLHFFPNDSVSDGCNPKAGLIRDPQGALYGTTYEGGLYGYGAVFKLTPPKNGQGPWTETVLYSFCSSASCFDGSYPAAGLILGPHGALYGTTNEGGYYNQGTVFKLTPPASGQSAWTETVLYNFCQYGGPSGCNDGFHPVAGVIFGANGELYGTTSDGSTYIYGSVFKLTPPASGQSAWTYTTLHYFASDDGVYPLAGLIRDPQGALYGTTHAGGQYDYGTVFMLTPPAPGETAWTYTVLYSFTGGSDGARPVAGLIRDSQGALYGTANDGGIDCGAYGCGTVFQLTPPKNGPGPWTYTVLYSFTGGSDGAYPAAGLILDPQGALYGTANEGGIDCGAYGCGTVFQLTPPKNGPGSWTYTTLHRFASDDGAYPAAGLILDPQGALYGTTNERGIDGDNVLPGCGTVFQLTPPANGKGAGKGQTAVTETRAP
jgi:uncharacterized repeat protein (TIGR03803 family)